jgi:hypothetical protein
LNSQKYLLAGRHRILALTRLQLDFISGAFVLGIKALIGSDIPHFA